MNNLPSQTTVTGSSRERRTVLQLNYSASMEQVSAITDSAEHCEQLLTYACRMSRLLNTPGKDVRMMKWEQRTFSLYLRTYGGTARVRGN